MKYQLWLSFTACVRAVVRDGLDIWSPNLLFYFGCRREHVMLPVTGQELHEVSWFLDRDDLEAQEDFMVEFSAAIKKAEEEGRVLWRETRGDYELHNAENLEKFLQGYDVTAQKVDGFAGSYHATARGIQAATPGFDVRC